MKRLYLTSSIHAVAHRISKDFKLAKGNNRLVFITTASEDKKRIDKSWLINDRNSLIDAGFDVFDYTITGKKESEIRNDLKDFDFVFVLGGNTFYLLEKSQESGFINVVRELVLNKEKIYIGSSAGSVIAGPDISGASIVDDNSLTPNLKDYKGFGLVDFVVFSHWGNEKFKESYLNQRLDHSYDGNGQIILLRDNQYVEIKNDWYRIVEV